MPVEQKLKEAIQIAKVLMVAEKKLSQKRQWQQIIKNKKISNLLEKHSQKNVCHCLWSTESATQAVFLCNTKSSANAEGQWRVMLVNSCYVSRAMAVIKVSYSKNDL